MFPAQRGGEAPRGAIAPCPPRSGWGVRGAGGSMVCVCGCLSESLWAAEGRCAGGEHPMGVEEMQLCASLPAAGEWVWCLKPV